MYHCRVASGSAARSSTRLRFNRCLLHHAQIELVVSSGVSQNRTGKTTAAVGCTLVLALILGKVQDTEADGTVQASTTAEDRVT